MAAKTPLWRRIVTIPRLIYFGLGVAATLGLMSLFSGASEGKFVQAGFQQYLAERANLTTDGPKLGDCVTTAPETTDDANVVRLATCVWEQPTKNSIFQIGMDANAKVIFVDVKEQEKVN